MERARLVAEGPELRIVSLIPEATEILEALGLGDQVVELCLMPDCLSPQATAVFTLDALVEARPTLVFTSETSAGGGIPRARVRRAATALRPRPAVYALEPRAVGDILGDIKTVGDATGRQQAARELIERLRARIDAVSLRAAEALATRGPRRVVCLHQSEPPVAAGWWLAESIGLAGGIDGLDGVGRPPRAVTWDEIRAARPDLILRVDLTPPARHPSSEPTGLRRSAPMGPLGKPPPHGLSGAERGETETGGLGSGLDRVGSWKPAPTEPGGGAGFQQPTAAGPHPNLPPVLRVGEGARGNERGEVIPGPGTVDLLEWLLASIVLQAAGSDGLS